MSDPKNPIIKYLITDPEHMMPEELFNKLLAITEDMDVKKYLSIHLGMLDMAHVMDPTGGAGTKAQHMLVLAAMAVGYLYGERGNKSSAEIVTDLLKDLNIKEGKDDDKR